MISVPFTQSFKSRNHVKMYPSLIKKSCQDVPITYQEIMSAITLLNSGGAITCINMQSIKKLIFKTHFPMMKIL